MRKPPTRGLGGVRIQDYLECGIHKLEITDSIDEDWDTVFESYLISGSYDDFCKVMAYLQINKQDFCKCYGDIMDVANEINTHEFLIMLGFVARHYFRTEDFDKLTSIIYHTCPYADSEFGAISIAYAISGITRKAEHVPTGKLKILQQFVYSVVWPPDFAVALNLLRIERQMNRLLSEQIHYFATTVPMAPAGEVSEAIEIERMLILNELNNENRVSLRKRACGDLPYRLRRALGDESGIEDDLISMMETGEVGRRPDLNNVILVSSELDDTEFIF